MKREDAKPMMKAKTEKEEKEKDEEQEEDEEDEKEDMPVPVMAYRCPQCKVLFPTIENMEAHQLRVHAAKKRKRRGGNMTVTRKLMQQVEEMEKEAEKEEDKVKTETKGEDTEIGEAEKVEVKKPEDKPLEAKEIDAKNANVEQPEPKQPEVEQLETKQPEFKKPDAESIEGGGKAEEPVKDMGNIKVENKSNDLEKGADSVLYRSPRNQG